MNPAVQAAYSSPITREELVTRGLPIVRRLAFRLVRRLPPNVDVGDLIGAGSEGLLKAVEAYDPAEDKRFEPYATVRIRGAMLDELRAWDSMTRHGRRRLAEVTRAVQQLNQSLGRQPTEEEVAELLGMPLNDYQKLVESLARGPALGQLGELEPDELASSNLNPAAILDQKEMHRELAKAIKRLPERMQLVMALYYQEECTQAEIGRILEVTESRVCQILGEATVRLRAALGLDNRPRKKRAGASPERSEQL